MIISKDLVIQCRTFLETVPYSLLPVETDRLDHLVPALVDVVTKESNEWVLKEAVRLLGMIGPLALPAIPAIVALISRNPITPTEEEICLGLDRKQPWFLGWATLEAMSALKRISPQNAIQEISKLCHDPDSRVRYRFVRTLEKIGEPAEQVIPLLVEALRDWEVINRRAALLALWRYPILDESILDAVLNLTRDEDPLVRIRSDYLLASKRSGYQRLYTDTALELLSILFRTAEEWPPITTSDALATICMVGSDASHLLDLLCDALKSNIAEKISVVSVLNNAFLEMRSHYPSLVKIVSPLLRKMARGGNKAAALVDATLRFIHS